MHFLRLISYWQRTYRPYNILHQLTRLLIEQRMLTNQPSDFFLFNGKPTTLIGLSFPMNLPQIMLLSQNHQLSAYAAIPAVILEHIPWPVVIQILFRPECKPEPTKQQIKITVFCHTPLPRSSSPWESMGEGYCTHYTALPLHMQRGCFQIRTHDQQVT